MPKAPEPSSTCQKTTKSLPRISPKSYCYNAVPNRFLAHFSTSRTNGPRSLSRRKRVHTRLHSKNRTQRRTRRNRGHFGLGAITTLGTFRTFTNIPGPGIRTAYFAALGAWSRVLPKNAKSLRNSDALMRVAVPRRRGPAGLRDLFSFLSKLRFSHPVLRAFRVCETWEVSLPSACFACCRNAGRPLVKTTCLPFSEVG